MTTDIGQRGKSKHALIAEALTTAIQRGKYRVGELLPSEPELSAAFGVSRHTVRVALGRLQSLGLTVSHHGVGTQVHRDNIVSRYNYSFNSASDLLQYATKTKVRILDTEEISVDAALADYLDCKPAEHWWRIRTVRSDRLSSSVIAYSEIWIPLAFGSILAEIVKSKQPIFSQIETHFGESTTEIRQDIRAVSVTGDEAGFLGVVKNSAGLEITRRYIGKSGRVFEVARSVHPSDSFKYSMHVKLQVGA
ncbi:MAG: GntR family transcriptional regulator [Burkholderiales bacterium]|nr:GntR family transcriptional regulator [Burkholderiales bacterium]